VTFPNELRARTLVLRIIGFDLVVVEVGNIAIGLLHVGFFMKVALWLKTRCDFNGRKWSIYKLQKLGSFLQALGPLK
jgi:hypothetical protein